MQVELRPHPSKDANGEPVFPALRSIWAEGPEGMMCCGYTGDPPHHRLTFIIHGFGEDDEVVAKATELVRAEFGIDPDRVTNVPPPEEPDVTEYEYLDDDEDYIEGN